MDAAPDIATIGALLGSPDRAAMLFALADGKALPASELAYRASLSPQTASSHLARMVAAGLLKVERCGRHRYYDMATPEVAQIVEGLMALAPPVALRPRADRNRLEPLREGRSCYNHLAGRLGVGLAEAMETQRLVRRHENGYDVTREGERWLAELHIDVASLSRQRRLFASRCLDWSERRPHIGGALGDTLCQRLLTLKWIRRARNSRAVRVTETGRRALKQRLDLNL